MSFQSVMEYIALISINEMINVIKICEMNIFLFSNSSFRMYLQIIIHIDEKVKI